MKTIIASLLVVGILTGPSIALAQNEIRTEAVRFAPGKSSTTIRGRIVGRESVSYKVGAEAGQELIVRLRPSNRFTYFNIYEPGRGPGDEALAVSEITGPMVPAMNRFQGRLPTSGDYTISVYMVRAAARRNERSSFILDVAIPPRDPAALQAPVQADFADGLQGGPDFWEVRDVPRGDTLNMRREPSARSSVVARFRNGDALRNMGCRMAGGQRWCKVARPDDPAVNGWVAGRYLREGSWSGSALPVRSSSVDALVPGTRFHATGDIPCARVAGQPMGTCRFGVVRKGPGMGEVTVFWPDGSERVIYFESGAPVRFNRTSGEVIETMTVNRNGDLQSILIGTERFEIPDVVITGG